MGAGVAEEGMGVGSEHVCVCMGGGGREGEGGNTKDSEKRGSSGSHESKLIWGRGDARGWKGGGGKGR